MGLLDDLIGFAVNKGIEAATKKIGVYDALKDISMREKYKKGEITYQEYSAYQEEKEEAERAKRLEEQETQIDYEDEADNDVTPNDICGIVEYTGTAAEITSKEYIALWEKLLTEHSGTGV